MFVNRMGRILKSFFVDYMGKRSKITTLKIFLIPAFHEKVIHNISFSSQLTNEPNELVFVTSNPFQTSLE